MKTEGRTKKSVKNVKVMAISKVITIILSFVARTFFIRYLSTDYLGINGLFTNILTILSFAELGIGNAIIFKLYKPVANDDKEKVKTLLNFYKKVYIIVGLMVLFIGLCILPFITFFINDDIIIKESIYLIFFLFLVNSSVSYFFTYKRSIVIANQDEYVISIIDLIINIISTGVKIILLIMTSSFVIYLLISIVFTILNNIIISIAANKRYPYIIDKEYKIINKEEKKSIFSDVKSILLYKIGYILSNGTDNIIISKSLGVSQVGLLSNYTMIITGLNSLLSSVFNSLTGSIGNLNALKDSEQKEKVFYEILYLSFLVYGIVTVCLILLLNKFIIIWLGEDYLLSLAICIALGFNFYVDGTRFVTYTFRNTLGLFKKGRFTPLISSITNIILSLILVRYIQMFGVLIATGLTRLFILTVYDPYLIHKYEFKTNYTKFYIRYLIYFLICSVSLVICYYANNMVNINGLSGFIICGFIDIIITLIIMITFTFKTDEFKSIKKRFIKR